MDKKGLSPAMWVIVAIVVALIVALIVVMIVNNSSSSVGRQSNSSITSSGDGMNLQTCQTLCDSCKLRYPTTCITTEWNSLKPASCASFTCS